MQLNTMFVKLVGFWLCITENVHGISIGVIASEFSFRPVAGAMTFAVEELDRELLVGLKTNMAIVWQDTEKNPALGVGYAMDFIMNGTDVIIGDSISYVNVPIALLTSYKNIPHISWGATDPEMTDKTQYSTLVRTLGPYSKIGKAVVGLFKNYGWKRAAIFSFDFHTSKYAADGLRSAFLEYNITLAEHIMYEEEEFLTDGLILSSLKRLRRSARILFLSVRNDAERRIMLQAYRDGMCNGDYIFITPNLLPPDGVFRPWYADDPLDEEAKEAYRCVFSVSIYLEANDREFRELVANKSAEAPFFDDWLLRNGQIGGRYASYLHDAVILYGMWLNYSTTHNMNYRDGRSMFQFTKNVSFVGRSGPVSFDNNGDRQLSWFIHGFNYPDGEGRVIAIADTTVQIDKALIILSEPIWPSPNGQAPTDTPVCGFFNELCQSSKTDTYITSILSVAAVLVVIIVLVAVIYTVRKRRLQEMISKMIWKISMEDITPISSKHNEYSLRSLHSGFRSKFMMSRESLEVNTGNVGLYQGIIVFAKEIDTERVTLSRDTLTDLKNMKEMSHENVNAFIGASIQPGKVHVIFSFVRKGSLQDILENEGIQLDWMFKFSFISDIVQGMTFLHSSDLKFHGRLSSANCVVDGRWVLKITDYGMFPFREHSRRQHFEDVENKSLWMAPEILRLPEGQNKGSPKGDVYSFAVILHEIYYRTGPFGVDMDLKDILVRIMNVEVPPFRPFKYAGPDVPKTMVMLMEYCWAESPHERMSFDEIRKYIRRHNIDQKCGIMDLMVQKLEKYASNLESLVEQRTAELMEEKKKTDRLLNRMLPQSVAEKLKKGEPIFPEYFEHVTIFFSDIVGFTTISARSTPMQVVDMLNDLYTSFDKIIESHDTYKMETIGDAYMVVSGLPIRNGNKHVAEIAEMSLDILSCVDSFPIRHLPDEKLYIRIGIHTGPCCAGVVGLMAPKYCLFGDTVNTASRMESNGQSMRIHVSEASYNALQVIGNHYLTIRGEMQIKGKGLMTTFWLVGKDGFTKPLPQTLHDWYVTSMKYLGNRRQAMSKTDS